MLAQQAVAAPERSGGRGAGGPPSRPLGPPPSRLPLRPDRIHAWGRRFTSTADLETAFGALTAVCGEAGLRLEERRLLEAGPTPPGAGGNDGRREVARFVQAGCRRWIRRQRALQEVHAFLELRGEELALALDFRMFRFYFWETVLLGLGSGAAFLAVPALEDAGLSSRLGGWAAALQIGLLVGGAVAVLLALSRLRAIGSGTVDRFSRELVERFEAAGASLVPDERSGGRRWLVAVLVLLGGFLAAVAALLVALSPPPGRGGHDLPLPGDGAPAGAFLLLLAAGATLLLVTLLPMARQPGFSERVAFVASGLTSTLAALFLVTAPFAGAYVAVLGVGSDLSRTPGGTAAARLLLAAVAAWLAGGLALAAWSVSLAAQLDPELRFRRRQREWTSSRLAFGDRRLVRRFQALQLAAWAVLSVPLLAGLVLSAAGLAAALAPRSGLLEAWTALLAAAGGPQAGSGAPILARSFLAVHGAAVVLLAALSLGSLAIRRCRRRREVEARPLPEAVAGGPLADAAGHCIAAAEALRRATEALRRAAGLGPVGLALGSGSAIGGEAVVFGRIRRRRWVVVTKGALERLPADRLAALVAHELAHHLHRRPDLDVACRWLGRLTFAGDGFARAVQHSHGYEEEADATAFDLLERAGLDPRGLGSLLATVYHAGRVAPPGTVRGEGLPVAGEASASAAAGPTPRMPRPAGRRPLEAFLAQYQGRQEAPDFYFHPISGERRAAVARLEAKWRRSAGVADDDLDHLVAVL